MKRETLFLKLAVCLIGIPVLAFCIFGIPGIAKSIAENLPNWAFMQYPFLIDAYASALTFFFALYQVFRLLSYIDKNKAFSELSVKSLKNIKYCAVTVGILHVFVLPLFYVVADMDDAPGVVLVGMAFVFAPLVVAVFAAVLQKLLQDAIEIKSENDLTV